MNTETKHTPGLIAANFHETWGIYYKGTRLATVFDIGSPESQHALAEQFASAPDMAREIERLKADKAELLAGLKNALVYATHPVHGNNAHAASLTVTVRALIAKHSKV